MSILERVRAAVKLVVTVGTQVARLSGLLVAYLVQFGAVILGVIGFLAAFWLLYPVLSAVGASDQQIAAVAGVAVIVGLWTVALQVLFGVNLLGRLRRLADR
ncbi:hypothetical protein [Halovivax gelatinilyticus]|uniref:hypothetical protein n=1 Tax=Halovivax gelatinilyticus TaxID=2961597 RepID=UPI0020CA69A7|nr:hypothetical protein [Halovivax gelatinilyticus]